MLLLVAVWGWNQVRIGLPFIALRYCTLCPPLRMQSTLSYHKQDMIAAAEVSTCSRPAASGPSSSLRLGTPYPAVFA